MSTRNILRERQGIGADGPAHLPFVDAVWLQHSLKKGDSGSTFDDGEQDRAALRITFLQDRPKPPKTIGSAKDGADLDAGGEARLHQ